MSPELAVGMACVLMLVLLHIRLSFVARRLVSLERTGVLIEDIRSKQLKQMKPATPRQKQRYIERVMNSGGDTA